jgi:hypothetical protein
MIQQIDQNTFQQSKGPNLMTLKRSDHGGWEMMTSNPSTRAWNRMPSIKRFASLVEVESNYKSWFGVTKLIEDHAH